MVFDHTLLTPPLTLTMVFLLRTFFLFFFSLILINYYSKWILVKTQTLKNMFEANFQTTKLFLSPYLSLHLR